MDKRERDEQIGRAAHNDLQSRYSVPETWEEADQFVRDEMTLVAIAAVSRAYEIDGVDRLVETLEGIANAKPSEWDDPGDKDEQARAFKEWAQSRARFAIAKYREARGE